MGIFCILFCFAESNMKTTNMHYSKCSSLQLYAGSDFDVELPKVLSMMLVQK